MIPHHLRERKSGQFPTLSGRESNCQFDFGPSFDHNLCFRYPNGSCKPILDIYIPRAFQLYKECLNPMSFDPCNRSLKIQESTRTLTPKTGVPLGVQSSIPHTLLHSQEHEMWLLGFVLARILASPCLGHEPKARVVTTIFYVFFCLFGFFFLFKLFFCTCGNFSLILVLVFKKLIRFLAILSNFY
jgi:hypothetical protein